MSYELNDGRSSRFDFRDFVSVIFRHKWMILFTLLTAGAAAAFFSWRAPDIYASQMKILVRNMRTETSLTPGVDAVADRAEVSQEQINSEIEVLKSRDLLEAVVVELNLAEPLVKGKPVDGRDVERAIEKLDKDLDVSTVKKANIIEVRYSSKSAETSARVLEHLSELYFEKHIKIHRAPGTFDFFKDQADKYKENLRSAENSLSTFQSRQNVVEIDRQKELTLTKKIETKAQLTSLEGSIKETTKRIAELESQLANTSKRINTQSRVLPNQFSAERLNTLLVELRNRRIGLLAKFKPGDRVVKEVDEQIAETNAALQKATASSANEFASDINPLWQELSIELSRAKTAQAGRIALKNNLASQIARYEAELDKLERVTPVHENLSRDVSSIAETYQLYAKKQEEARINDALDTQKISNVSIAEAPSVPKNPDNRNKLMAVMLSLGLGCGLCAASVFLSEMNRKTFVTPNELEEFAGVPVLATIPEGRLSNGFERLLSGYPEEPQQLR
ncbi:MAG: Wzz/FepE/Etk N-terminal domain-containing protein [Acidobacteriota bacterium]|nr:Wzz/FepE/Etk N-terminal domain-containing protein [Acidobacteriota bacterium]MDH3530931.1 Wzz/FepE/Etk N-terminal domain-containing protein [Acidobacteriota bacterium]